MAVKVIDPRDLFVGEQRDKNEIIMHSNLCIPSFMHSYSMAVEFAKDWFLSNMPINYFRKKDGRDSIHINEKYIFDDYRRLSKAERLKKEKPYLIMSPQINFDFDLDNIHMYNYGADLLTRTGWQSDSFFRDAERGLYLLMNMQLIELKMDYRVSLYTRAQQIDMFKKMEIWFRIGATESQDRDMDFHIPNEILYNLAYSAGFDVDKSTMQVKNPLEFSRYLNSHSSFPILYKFRKSTGNFEFFMRVPMLPIHINLGEKLRLDDGEMQGQLHTNYNIDMSATFRVPAPQFYVYYTKEPVPFRFDKTESSPMEKESFDLCTYKVVDIALCNKRGWEKFVWSKYEYDEEDGRVIDLRSFIGSEKEHSEFYKVIEATKKAGLSPSIFIEIKVYTADPTINTTISCSIDWWDYKIILAYKIDPQLLYLAMYVDLNYYNRMLSDADKMYENRMVEHKDQRSKEMVMNNPVH